MSKKDRAILDLSDPKQRKMLINHINSLDGKHWVEITRCRRQRSLNQNAYLWGVVYPAVAAGLEEAWGESLAVEEVHDWLKNRFNSRLIVNRNTGEVLGRRPASTADLDTGEFGEYLDKVIRFAAEQLGVVVPSPDDLRERDEQEGYRHAG